MVPQCKPVGGGYQEEVSTLEDFKTHPDKVSWDMQCGWTQPWPFEQEDEPGTSKDPFLPNGLQESLLIFSTQKKEMHDQHNKLPSSTTSKPCNLELEMNEGQ